MAATRLGYAVALDFYQGKRKSGTHFGIGEHVVLNLLNKLPQNQSRHYHLVFDNFFTSVSLITSLREKGIAATGTLRSNRDANAPLTSVAEMAKQARGSVDFATVENSNVCLVRWRDSKPVTVASSYCGVYPMKETQRYFRSEKLRKTIPFPSALQVYNANMGGVDRLDQNLDCYMTNIRSKKWWWPIFRYCLDLAVVNAHYLFRLQSGVEKLDLLGFRRSIATTYLKQYVI